MFGSQLFSELKVKVVVINYAAVNYNNELGAKLVRVDSGRQGKLLFMVCFFLFRFHDLTLFIFFRCQRI